MNEVLLRHALDWALADASHALIALWVVGGFAKVVIREAGAVWRAWLQYRPPPQLPPQRQKPRRLIDEPIPKLLEARRRAEEGGRDEEPADDSEEVPIVEVALVGPR